MDCDQPTEKSPTSAAPCRCQLGPVYTLDGITPVLAGGVFIAPTAAVIGAVELGVGASVWFGAIVRGDDLPIRIGPGTNIQDGAIVHGTEGGAPVEIGADVVVGHGAILHGCTVGDSAIIGMGSIVLDGARIGAGAVIAAGAVVPPGKEVPAGELWVGNPAAKKRNVGSNEVDFVAYATPHYRRRATQYTNNAIGYTPKRTL